jgi:hypothetical protein
MVAVRLFFLSPGQNDDPTLSTILAGILTEGALEYALAATSVIALKPFLKPFHSGAIINTVGGAGSGMYSGSRSQTRGMYMLSSVSKKDNDISTRSATTNSDPQEKVTQDWPRNGHQKGSSRAEAHRGGTISRGTPRGSTGSEEMIIQTTKDWSVHYEERDNHEV